MRFIFETWIKIQKSRAIASRLMTWFLLPLSIVYFIGYSIKSSYQKAKTKKVNGFVICIGNAITGGGGKTPTALALGRYIRHRLDLPAAFILRGYGGKLSNKNSVVKVDHALHTEEDVGDEALLLAEEMSTYISANRYLAADKAVKDGAKVVIMDDGMQNFELYKDKVICVFTNSIGIGNGLIFPAGMLREPMGLACKRADKIIVIDDDYDHDKLILLKSKIATPFPIFKSCFFADSVNVTCNGYKICVVKLKVNSTNISGQRFIGLVGIAHPEKFIHTAVQAGADLLDCHQFPDHYRYSELELQNVYNKAKTMKCKVLTTSKDFVRIPTKYHAMTEVLRIELEIDESFMEEICIDRSKACS